MRIGTFVTGPLYKKKTRHCTATSKFSMKTSFILALLISNYCLLALSLPTLLQPHHPPQGPAWQQQHCSYTLYTACMGCPAPSLGTTRYKSSITTSILTISNTHCAELQSRQSDIWDPGVHSNGSLLDLSPHTPGRLCPRETSTDRNKMAHITHGNRGQRGRGITCVYWNKGPSFLCNKMLDIETIMQTHKPHILGLGEANFRHDHDVEDVQLQGYTLHLDSSVHNPNLGMARVVVYTNNILRVKRRQDLEDDKVAAIWLECGLPNQRGVLVCIGYRQWRLLGQSDSTSASVPEQLARWTVFLDNWEKAIQEDKEVIVALDANIDHLTWRMQESLPQHSSSVRLKSLIDALFARIIPLGVTQLVTGATRMERGQPRTGLDHLYTNKVDKLSSVETFFTGTSDHKLLKVIRFTKSFKHLPRYVRKRSFKDFDEDAFKLSVRECGLEEIFSCTNVNIAAETLTNKLTEVLDNMAPIKKIQTRINYAPWMTKETKVLKVKREAAHKKAAETDSQEDWRLFRALRNQVTAKCRDDKQKWERKKLDLEENNSSGVWKTVKGWLGWGTSGTPTQLFWEGRMVTSPSGLASAMNKFFLDKVKKLRNGIPLPTSDPLSKFKEAMRGRECSFSIKPVQEDQILKIIKGLKNSSATGVDYIDTRTIKLIAELITPVLTYIINLSIQSSTFPTIWKWAKVIPLLKSMSADAILPKSYRPVALLPILSKVMEKVVFTQLVEYLEHNRLIHPNLHGCRVGHNTSTALLQLYDKWVEEVEEDKMVGVLFCDQSAAFDLCDHTILLEKLKLMGLEESALYWIRSYLSSRKQSCFVDGELSTALNLFDCGVPQGSIGGPLLWLCFTCDQPDVVHDHPVVGQDLHRGCLAPALGSQQGGGGDCGELVGYVDDGAYSYAHSDPAVISRVLTEKYNMLEEWMSNNKLVINPDKTHIMVIGTKKSALQRHQVSMMAGGFCIKPTETEKLLGGQVHQSLKWNQHIADSKSSLVKQLTSRNNGLKRISRNAKFNTRLMVANGAVQSKLVYLITLWGGAQQYLLKALQVQQLTAARTVCGFQSWRWSRTRLLKRVGWMSVRQLIEFHTVLQAHKTIVTGLPRPLHASLSAEHPYKTRSATNGNIRLGNNITSNNTFKYRAMVSYNSVPGEVKRGSMPSVKKKLKQWILKNVPLDWG